MSDQKAKLAAARRHMVDRQLRGRGIHPGALLETFAATPRERFIPPARADQAYEDRPISIGYGQTISQPYIVALMVQELSLRPDHRVLDVGAGSGYQTAILAAMAGHVYAIERFEALTERAMSALASINAYNVTICTGDGTLGWPEEAPFDRIICGAAAPEVPQTWIDQLADGGRIVLPLGGPEVQSLVAVEKVGGRVRRREICDVRFVRLIGQAAWPQE